MHYKHYALLSSASNDSKLFNVGTCPACGAEVVEPNAVGCSNPPADLMALGMTGRDMPDNERQVNENGEDNCDACVGM